MESIFFKNMPFLKREGNKFEINDFDKYQSQLHNFNIVFPGCGGRYHYWFGVIAALQFYIDKKYLNKINWHTISGSGIPVTLLMSEYDICDTYDKLSITLSEYYDYGGILYFYDFLYYSNSMFLNRKKYKNKHHILYTYDVYNMKRDSFNGPSYNKEKYSRILLASCLIPIINFKTHVNIDNSWHIDGCAANYYSVDNIDANPNTICNEIYDNNHTSLVINMETLLNYESMLPERNNFTTGILYSDNKIDFYAGWKDMEEKIKNNMIPFCTMDDESIMLHKNERLKKTINFNDTEFQSKLVPYCVKDCWSATRDYITSFFY